MRVIIVKSIFISMQTSLLPSQVLSIMIQMKSNLSNIFLINEHFAEEPCYSIVYHVLISMLGKLSL